MNQDDLILDYLKFLLKGLVDEPDNVEITRKVDEMGVLYTVVVAQVDRGQIIGKGGAMANTIREIIRTVGIRNKETAKVKFDF